MRLRQVFVFYSIAIGITWLIGLPLYGPRLGIEGLPVVPHHHFLLAIGPFAAALIVTAATSGREGLQRLAERIVQWRAPALWYSLVLFGPFALFLAAGMTQEIVTGTPVDAADFSRSREFPGLSLLAVWAFHTLTFGLGEEVGWRGFALPRLQVGRSALGATVILAILWGIWHAPMFLYRDGFTGMNQFMVLGWFASMAMAAVLLTWLYNSTHGSILFPILFHGSFNVAFTSEAADGSVGMLMSIMVMVWALVVIFVAGPQDLSRYGRHTIEAPR